MRIKSSIRRSPLIVLAIFTTLIFLRDSSKWFYFLSMITNEIVGVSIWTNCVMIYYSIRHKLCAYYYLSMCGFMLFNITNILQLIFYIVEFEFLYFNIYVGILSLIILFSSIIFLIIKHEKRTDKNYSRTKSGHI